MDTTTYAPKANCFGFIYRNRVPACGALNEMLCKTKGKCPFYKPKIQASTETERAYVAAKEQGYYQGGKYVPKG